MNQSGEPIITQSFPISSEQLKYLNKLFKYLYNTIWKQMKWLKSYLTDIDAIVDRPCCLKTLEHALR